VRSDRPGELLQWTADSLDLVDLQTGRRKQVLANPPPDASGRILWSKSGGRWGTREQVHTVQEDGTITTWPSTGHLVFETPLGVTHAGARSERGTLHAAHGQWSLEHHGWHDPVDWGGPWLLATTLANGSIQLLDARDGHLQRKLVGHTSSILHMVKVGDWLATASHDQSVRLWRPRDADSGWIKRVDTGLRPSLVRAGERVAVLGRTSSDRWAVWTPALGGVTLGTGNTSNIDPYARMAAMVNERGALTVVDLETGQQRTHPTGLVGTRCIEIATELDRALLSNLVEYQVYRLSDGERLASGPLGDHQPMHCAHLDRHGTVWRFVGRPAQAHPVGEPPMQVPFDGAISGVHFAPHALVLRGFDGQIAIQRGETLELVVPEHAKHFTVTDKALAWTGNQGIVHFESEPSWASGPGSRIHALAFAAGNRLLLAGRDNGHLDVWTRTGEQIASVQAHAHPIHEIDVDAQTGHIITIDTRGVAQWWEPGRLFTESTDVVTNLRTCRGTERVVPVLPFPNPSDRWAPAAACEDT